MLLKVDCEPKLTVSISLTFDDGTVKELDIKKGMYGTFKYLQKGATNTISGEVIEVSAATVAKRVAKNITETPGYICDPNYRNIGVIDARPPKHPYHAHNALYEGIEYDSVERQNKCAIRVLTQYGHVVTITTDTIMDVDILYMDSKPVMSPDDDTRVRFMKMASNNELLVSRDGVEWDSVVTENGEGVAEKVQNNYDNITLLRSEIESLKAEINALKLDKIDDSTTEE
jgi:hypothetical protein